MLSCALAEAKTQQRLSVTAYTQSFGAILVPQLRLKFNDRSRLQQSFNDATHYRPVSQPQTLHAHLLKGHFAFSSLPGESVHNVRISRPPFHRLSWRRVRVC